jgi:hypothetical protein
MTPTGNDLEKLASQTGPFVFPGAAVDTGEAVADEEESTYVVFQTVAASDAPGLCTRLESHGIPSEIGARTDVGDPAHVDIKVREVDRAAAEEAIADQGTKDDGSTEEDRERLIADWVCPECRRRTLVQLPLSKGARWLRFAWVLVLLIPLLVMLVLPSSPAPDIVEMINRLPDWWPVAWLASVAVLACVAIIPTRGRRCTECAWRSDRNSYA